MKNITQWLTNLSPAKRTTALLFIILQIFIGLYLRQVTITNNVIDQRNVERVSSIARTDSFYLSQRQRDDTCNAVIAAMNRRMEQILQTQIDKIQNTERIVTNTISKNRKIINEKLRKNDD